MDVGGMNFEAEHEEDDDEFLREEEEEQKAELQARLANAFDDLLDDTDTSGSSGALESHNVSLDVSRTQQSDAERPCSSANQHPPSSASANQIPPDGYDPRFPPPDHFMPSYGAPGGGYEYHSSQGEGEPVPYSPHEGHPQFAHGHGPYPGPYYDGHYPAISPQYLGAYPPGYHGDPNNYEGYHGDHNGYYGYNSDGYHGSGDGYHIGSSQDEPGEGLHSDQERYHGYERRKSAGFHSNQENFSESVPKNHSRTSTSEDKSVKQQVKYNGPISALKNVDVTEDINQSGDRSECATPAANEQRQFIEAAGTPDTRTLAQLRILYKAQARTIDELKDEIKNNQDEQARETRMLTHKITLLQGDKEGLMATLDHNQTLVKQTQAELLQFKTKFNDAENQISSLTTAKQDLHRKLESAETTINELNQQLMNLGKSDTLARQRDRQETMIKCMQQKHASEVYSLKEKLDLLSKELNDKTSECTSVREQLQAIMSMSDQSNLGHVQTVQSLTQSLQEALKAGSSVEFARMQNELKQTREKQQMEQEMYKLMQEEVNEMKEQLIMYESASQYGVYPGSKPGSRAPSPVDQSDSSFVQLNIKNNNNNNNSSETPGKLETEHNDEDTGARLELKRCLQNYRQKQLQLSKSQGELRTLKRDYLTLKSDMERLVEESQKTKADLERQRSSASENSSPRVLELEKQLAALKKDKSDLEVEVESLRDRIADLASAEERLTEVNAQLSNEMSQFIREYETHRQDDVDRYQATFQHHYEDSKERIKQELIANFNEERRKLIQMYEHQTEKYKSENEYLTKEMMSIKEMYVSMCHEKDEVAETVQKYCENSKGEQMEKVREELRREKESELNKLRQSLQETYRVQLTTAKEQWLRENESETRRKVEAEISAARVAWFEEHRADKQTAVETALRTARDEWGLNVEKDLRQKLMEAEESWRVKQKAELDVQVRDMVSVECEKLNLKHRAELDSMRERLENEKTKYADQVICKAKADWLRELDQSESRLRAKLENEFRVKFEKQLSKSLSEARDKWLAEKHHDLSRLVDTHRTERGGQGDVGGEYSRRVNELEQALEDTRAERLRLEAEVTSLRRAAQDEQQTLVKMKDLEICSLKARKERLEQDQKNARSQATTDREALLANHQALIVRKDNEIKALKNINNILEAELKGLKIENETSLGQCESLKLRNENLEKEFVTAKGTWLAETESVIREKDQELEKLTQSLNEKHRQVLERTAQEHSDILGQALRSAKEEMEKEKADLTSRYEAELQRLRERERQALENFVDNPSDKSILQEMESKFTRERTDVDQSWCRRITGVQSRFEREKKDLMDDWQKRCDQLLDKYQNEVHSRDQLETMVQDLRTALEKERNQDKNWERKLSVLRDAYEREKDVLKASHREDLSRTVEVLKRKKDSEQKLLTEKWEKAVTESRNELERRDALLKQADSHLEAEVEKLRQTLQEEQGVRLEAEIQALHARYHAEFSHATNEERIVSQRQLDEASDRVVEIERHYESVIQTYQDKLSLLREGQEATLMDLRTDLEQRQIDLDQQDAAYRRQINELKTSLESEYNAVLESCEQEKNEFANKLELCQEQLQRVRSEKDHLDRAHQNCERRLADLAETERRHENEMGAVSKNHERELSELRRRLEEHHNNNIQAMKSKVMEMRKNHAVAMETMKAQVVAEQRETGRRPCDSANKQVQTEEIHLEQDLMDDIRTQYLNTVNRIRADVLRHVTSTNQRAAQNVRTELKKGQHHVARKYKEHYMGCFKQILKQTNSSDVEVKMNSLERALSKPIGNLNTTSYLQETSSQSALDSQNSKLSSNQSEAYTNTDFSLDEDYLYRNEEKSQEGYETNRKTRSAGQSQAAVVNDSGEKATRSLDNSGRDISKSSEKYPIRNISPRRHSNTPTDSNDAQRPSRDMTSGYRSSSYLSVDTDTSGHHGNETPGNGQTNSKNNTPRYRYTSLRKSIEGSEYIKSPSNEVASSRQPTTPETRGCYSNQNTPRTYSTTPSTNKVMTPRAVHSAPKYASNGSNYSNNNSHHSNGRHQPAERPDNTKSQPVAGDDSFTKTPRRGSSEKSKTTRPNGYHGNGGLAVGSPVDRSVVKPVPLCTRQTQVPSR